MHGCVSEATDRIDRGHPPSYFVLGDALRGIACLVVVVYHATLGAIQHVGGAYAADPIGAYGAFSFVALRIGSPTVYVFLALSGYLVGGPWVRAWLGERPPPKVPTYIGRRARRILPAFWLVIALRLADKGQYAFTDHQVLGTFLGLQTFYGGTQQALMPQGWTVDVEAFFYLTLPLLFLVGRRLPPLHNADRVGRRRALVGFLVLWSVLGIAVRTRTAPDGALGHSVLTLGWAFAPGMIAAAYETQLRALLPARRTLGRVAGLGLIATAILAEAVVVGFQINDGLLVAEVAHLLCGAGFVGGALVYEWSGAPIPLALDNGPIHALGRWSYGIYLLHITVAQHLLQDVPADLGPRGVLVYLLAGTAIITTALAAVMWRYWEEPWLDWRWPWRPKDKLARRVGPTDLVQGAIPETPAPTADEVAR
ncbi:MAG: acyltransferase 3 [Solirubrobacterales bacterium]|nr:acyltransferase 3 [Solirubrobacterales bacterium]